jgi:hypothetical protein
MIQTYALPKTPPSALCLTESLQKTAMRAAAAAQYILFSHPAKAYDDIATLPADSRRTRQRGAPQTGAPAQRQHGNAMGECFRWRSDGKLAAEEMDFMAEIAQAFRGPIQVPLRATSPVESLMGEPYFHTGNFAAFITILMTNSTKRLCNRMPW